MARKNPWWPFYADDWLSDEKLRACSSAARGLWIDLLCLMHKNDRRGFLEIAARPASCVEIARMTGRTSDEVSQQLQELLAAGVASASEHGVLFSRRMVRDEELSRARARAGSRGAAATNGRLPRQKGRQNAGKRAGKSPASESESESESEGKNTPLPPKGGAAVLPRELDTPEFRAAWALWEQHRAETRHPLKPTTTAAQLKKLAGWGVAKAVASLEQSIAHGWQGLFEPATPPAQDGRSAIDRAFRDMEARNGHAMGGLGDTPRGGVRPEP